MTAGGTLLERAIKGVRTLALPACIKDSALRYVFVNDAYCNLMGCTPEDLLGRSTNQATDNAGREEKERSALVSAQEQKIDCAVTGLSAPISLHCERFINDDDSIYLYEVFEQAVTLAALQAEEKKFRREIVKARADRIAMISEQKSLLQSLPFGVLLLNKDHIIKYANPAFYRLWDVNQNFDITGKSYYDYLAETYLGGRSSDGSLSLEEVHKALMAFFESNKAVDTCELHFLNGAHLYLIKNKMMSGNILLTTINVTNSRNRESEMANRLKRSEAAERTRAEFVENMSHEMRTPVNGILNMAELLAQSGLSSHQQTLTDIIIKSSTALLNVISDILDLSKLEASKLRLRPAPFSASDTLEDVASLLAPRAQQKDIELLVSIKPSALATISGDASRFRQIAINLIGNAIKFTDKGHVLVELDLEPNSSGESKLTFRVSDSGIGIRSEDLKTIFNRCKQAGIGPAPEREGNGLGLTITAGLVKLFGGTLEVKSEPNKGSVFTVSIPVKQIDSLKATPLTREDGSRPSVLTIGGTEIGHAILAEQLENLGIEGHHAIDGNMGLAILREASVLGKRIDAVIVDQQHCNEDALEIAKSVHDESTKNPIGIILINDIARYREPTQEEETILDTTLLRPLRNSALHAALSNAIAGKSSAPSDLGEPPIAAKVTPVADTHERPDVLIAEDDEVNQIVFAQIMKRSGLTYRIVDNGQLAFDVWRQERPTLIFMDISMPEMNGYDATKLIREAERVEGLGAHVPIIAVSGYITGTEKDTASITGMDDFLVKPISPDMMLKAARKWLEAQLDKKETMTQVN